MATSGLALGRGVGSPAAGSSAWLRGALYASFFLSGAAALDFEIVWSRQSVPVFGNSAYAISAVLCAFMAGLGIGGWLGGRLADRSRRPLLLYAALQAGLALWALVIPAVLAGLRGGVPHLAFLASGSPLASTAGRFIVSLATLLVPCTLMGAGLPVLSRFTADSPEVIGGRVGLLYGLNTLGAAAGCFAVGHLLVDTFGLSATNRLAAAAEAAVAAGVLALSVARRARSQEVGRLPAMAPPASEAAPPSGGPASPSGPAALLLGVAFLSGLGGLAAEVLWVRYLSFFTNAAYAFTTILGIYLVGVAAGGLIYCLFLSRAARPLRSLATVQAMLAVAVPLGFAATALVAISSRVPERLPRPATMTAITVALPTLLMGISFPLICAAFARSVSTAGRNVGGVYALNTAGSVAGSLLPVFVLVPWLGIQNSLVLVAALYLGSAAALFRASGARRLGWTAAGGAAGAVVLTGLLAVLAPGGLCRDVFSVASGRLARHTDVLFYREGRTGTSVLVRDKVNGLKWAYINSTLEVPTTYTGKLCFKLLGGLGPLLHARPDDVLMVCFGGGIAAGATAQYPEVRSLEVVDLESSIVEAARLLGAENNGLLDDPKLRVVIDDGRHYILASGRRWPVIVSDSTHPKTPDSWVLYTREFYETVRGHLTGDGVFVQWLPLHGLSEEEHRIIVRTFMSVFPHTSAWAAYGVDETGRLEYYCLLVSTPEPLRMDVQQLSRKLLTPAVRSDLQPFGLDTPGGLLQAFVCGEQMLAKWAGAGPVNTDDLPYTQYETRYSAGPPCTLVTLAGLMESAWPYLRNVPDDIAGALERKLAVRAQANELFCAGQLESAVALLLRDPKLLKFAENRREGAAYLIELGQLYRESPVVLNSFARLAAAQPGCAEAAEALYARLLSLEPRNAAAHNELGRLLLARGKPAEAAPHFLRALQADPLSTVALNNVGLCLAAQGDLPEAIAYYERALAVAPRDVPAHFNLAQALRQQGMLDEAAAHYMDVLKVAPGYAPARQGLQEVRAEASRRHAGGARPKAPSQPPRGQ